MVADDDVAIIAGLIVLMRQVDASFNRKVAAVDRYIGRLAFVVP